MDIIISLSVLCLALVIYVIILSLKLSKRNLFIKSTLNKIAGIEKTSHTAEIEDLLDELQRSAQYSSLLNDKILSRDLTDFIYENTVNMRVYMHYTREESDAKQILSGGFRFVDSFHHTALQVMKDNLDLKIKHNERKMFGDYLVIICISNEIVNKYTDELEKAGVKNCSLENLLTEMPPFRNENADNVYQLSPKFIKGYVNYRSGEIIRNPAFNPYYNSPAFMKNIASA